jgi:hypothetical protein
MAKRYKMDVLKGFAKSKEDFVKSIKRRRKRLNNELLTREGKRIDVANARPEMVEMQKAYKGVRYGGRLHRETLSDSEKKRLGAKEVFGDWNEYVREFESIKPKKGEHYYEARINVADLKAKKKLKRVM